MQVSSFLDNAWTLEVSARELAAAVLHHGGWLATCEPQQGISQRMLADLAAIPQGSLRRVMRRVHIDLSNADALAQWPHFLQVAAMQAACIATPQGKALQLSGDPFLPFAEHPDWPLAEWREPLVKFWGDDNVPASRFASLYELPCSGMCGLGACLAALDPLVSCSCSIAPLLPEELPAALAQRHRGLTELALDLKHDQRYARALCEHLPDLRGLQALHVFDTPKGMAERFSAALAALTGLARFECTASEEDFWSALRGQHRLHHLHVYNSAMQLGTAAAEALATMTALTCLRYDSSESVSAAGMAAFCQKLPKLKQLRHLELDLRISQQTVAIERPLAEALLALTQLQELRLRGSLDAAQLQRCVVNQVASATELRHLACLGDCASLLAQHKPAETGPLSFSDRLPVLRAYRASVRSAGLRYAPTGSEHSAGEDSDSGGSAHLAQHADAEGDVSNELHHAGSGRLGSGREADALEWLAQASSLQTLRIYVDDNRGDNSRFVRKLAVALQTAAGSVTQLQAAGIGAPSTPAVLSQLSNLRQLHIEDSDVPWQATPRNWATCLQQLSLLELFGCASGNGVAEHRWDALCEMPSLKHLMFWCENGRGYAGIAHYLHRMVCLRELRILSAADKPQSFLPLLKAFEQHQTLCVVDLRNDEITQASRSHIDRRASVDAVKWFEFLCAMGEFAAFDAKRGNGKCLVYEVGERQDLHCFHHLL